MFGHRWLKAEATVVERITSDGFNIHTIKEEWIVNVRPEQGEAFRAKVGQLSPLFAKDFRIPIRDDVRSVLFDPKSKKVKWDRTDPRLFWKEQQAKDKQAAEELLKAPVGTPPGSKKP